ncbi:hypothetical protein IWQ47_004867 [Aquimarina sp. EL_43]|uniref:hypothetical protein n=1 Tax=unclassified Aquimarina TaxID=2627091 RepID=UPI0018CA4135|nr:MULTISPECIES: hypothetical protein [unclassified Aquimarina]MBG6133457.1 hypothetical protein [Aquimarina sp. EL_35]MBG6153615.1 hypothetical protein [Aquimarina sp. EL_32]MBG6171771.1 hypothetical protein [Aquimarina sp. EL_43]
MKKLKDLDVHVIEDNSALTVKAGCGRETSHWKSSAGDWLFNRREYGDWEDDNCC